LKGLTVNNKEFDQLLDDFQPTEELTAEVTYRPGFVLRIMYWPDAKLQKNLKKSKKTVWDRHQKTKEVDTDKFRQKLVNAVLGWEGLTYKVLAEMGVFDLGAFYAKQRKEAEAAKKAFGDKEKEALANTEVSFSPEKLHKLMVRDTTFENFIYDNVGDPSIFPIDEERGNS
jgi:hypothetical protein